MSKARIKMLVGISGVDFSLSPGEETTRFTQKEAIRLIESGQAAPVAAPVERAVRRAATETRSKIASTVAKVAKRVRGSK